MQAHTFDRQLLLGLYYGFLFALACYNLFLFASIRDWAYLHYVGYVTGFALFQMCLAGHGLMYLWPDHPGWGDRAAVAFLQVSVACGLLFVRRMTNMVELSPAIHRVMGVFAVVFALLVPVGWVDYFVGVRTTTALTAITVFALPIPIVLAVIRGYRPARYLVLCYAAILPGAAALELRTLGVLPSTFWVEHAVQFGTALEAVLLSFTLADRINLLSRDRAIALRDLVTAERHALALQRGFAEQLLEVQDGERKRIASELHDGVGQDLLVVVNSLKRQAKRTTQKEQREQSAELALLAQSAVRALRTVAHDLHPHYLERLGLTGALRQLVERTLNAAEISYNLELPDLDGALPKRAEIHIYRIVQEGLNNIVKHAGARHARIAFCRTAEHLEVVLEDDGQGMGKEPPGFGQGSMDQRARLLGGTLSLEPRETAGLRVGVSIPLVARSH